MVVFLLGFPLNQPATGTLKKQTAQHSSPCGAHKGLNKGDTDGRVFSCNALPMVQIAWDAESNLVAQLHNVSGPLAPSGPGIARFKAKPFLHGSEL